MRLLPAALPNATSSSFQIAPIYSLIFILNTTWNHLKRGSFNWSCRHQTGLRHAPGPSS
ncbi:rCG61318 [Rattus norvegicus]|uniref:RCG61318 n=1 Tax=Rattus norvegicus TaxID=10116 RepID=A6HAI2_RAT|nr:rCG61318 [Rattus norvegicus]